MTSDTVSNVISDVLVYGVYASCALIVLTMALLSTKLRRIDEAKRARERARREWEASDDGRAEALEMERAAHRAELERDWPQFTIMEMP